ncbi:hypothetical protein [Clostridium ljungdahlii]|uniref:Uncharacterized protein n=1 Tax=Clostridium ljungdahlii TaxID=1538 RepID=A0A162KR53_9CLOT|nr:hypothetical protein [Clostridium ljungdahlii]OAA82836.1 hypothetical protein WY13_03904 [Clostridium ljungdahlii]
MSNEAEKVFLYDLVRTLNKKYNYETELRNRISQTSKLIIEYFDILQENLKNICEISNGDIMIKLNESNDIIARIKIFSDELIFKREKNMIDVLLKGTAINGDSKDVRINYIDCQPDEVNINFKVMDDILKQAFKDVIENIKKELK